MSWLFEFETDMIDLGLEPENPINPIPGHGLLNWLAGALIPQGLSVPDPEPEDWGWFVDVRAFGADYMIGATLHPSEAPSDPQSWTVQVHKSRKLSERLRGKNKLTADDKLCALIEAAIRGESRISKLSVSHGD